MADIAIEAQYAVGTIYLYFKDKQSLYLSLIEKKLGSLTSGIKEKVARVKGAKEKIKVLVKEQLVYFEENEDFFRIYFSERGGLRWTIRDKISRPAVEKFMRYLDYIGYLIQQAQREGTIKKELHPKRTAYLLASMMNATILPWLRGDSLEKERLRDLSDFVLGIFYGGVGTR